MQNGRALALMATVLGLFVACSGSKGPVEWANGGGGPGRVYEERSASDCPWRGLTLLVVDSALLSAGGNTSGIAIFVRDLGGRLSADAVFGSFTTVEPLPGTATFTGFRDGSRELWVNPGDARAGAFVVKGDRVERWPGLKGGCA